MDDILSWVFSSHRSRGGPLARLLRAMAMRRSQQRLGLLDNHMLRDIGLTPGQASLEAERSCWDAPAHWLR